MDVRINGAWLTVNRACNFRCPWCYALGSKFKPEDNMSFEEACVLIDFIHSLGVKNIILIGGETLFWKHLFETATYIKSLGMGSTVVTNGWLLGNPRFREKVATSDITGIGISLKAGNREQNMRLTKYDGFDRVQAGIRATKDWKHIRVETSTVMTTETLGNIDEIVRVAFENGSPYINIQMCGPVVAGGKVDGQYMPDPFEIVRVITEKYEVINAITGGNFSLEQQLPSCIWPPDFLAMLEERKQAYHGCHFRTRSGILFDRYGQVIACNHLYDYPLGKFGVDFTDVESFQQFWMQAPLVAFYDKMLSYPSKSCVTCQTFGVCGGGCPLQWLVREPKNVIPMKGGSNG
ncbi:radical SAM protein [candidate division WWE3 bacterium]|uniref:Radical SAM protein n=1 Tax=candidate division WWE3 bacterium TaxID=2053526 RepID=A0A7X9DJP9_UNCKA|nr:radical SAM protein [candidate division WWE3 bacterium]